MAKPKSILFPQIAENAFVDCSAIVLGRVKIGKHSSIWPHTVLRGDINQITVGEYTNIQDLSLVHVDRDAPCKIGNHVTAGHQVCLHGCTIGDYVLIGIGSIILSHAKINSQVLLGAGSLVPEGKVLESGFLYFGSPVKKIRALTRREIQAIEQSAKRYAQNARHHARGDFGRVGLAI